MAGATHPFFGNQYTNGGYIIGSFKFPEGLTRKTAEHLTKIATSDVAPIKPSTTPLIKEANPVTYAVKNETNTKWIIPIIIGAIAAAGSYFAYRYFKKKRSVQIPNVGVCEHCGEPLTGGKFVADDEKLFIICKKCGEKNYAKYPDIDETDSGKEN
jgi:formylmethanofuran dehydrogenase subunit E